MVCVCVCASVRPCVCVRVCACVFNNRHCRHDHRRLFVLRIKAEIVRRQESVACCTHVIDSIWSQVVVVFYSSCSLLPLSLTLAQCARHKQVSIKHETHISKLDGAYYGNYRTGLLEQTIAKEVQMKVCAALFAYSSGVLILSPTGTIIVGEFFFFLLGSIR